MSSDEASLPPALVAPPKRRRRVGRVLGVTTVGLVVVLAGTYAAACALAPVPSPTVSITEPTLRINGDDAQAQAIVDAQAEPTAVGWLHTDEVWANSDTPVPIASISKLVTVLVALDAQPLDAGADGPVHVWTAADAARQDEYLAADGVAFPIPIGTEVTVREMLELALIPSANDFAAAYAYSVFGDNEAFLAAVKQWQDREGLESLTLFEPTGMDERNAASPADVLRLTRLALQNETVAEIVALRKANLPWGIGTVTSTNPLFRALDGVVGAKTGRTSAAGYNLAAARTSDALGRDVVQLSVVLGRDTAEDRLSSSLATFSALDAAHQTVTITKVGERVGTATTVDGIEIPLVTSAGATSVLLPGEEVTRTITPLGAAAGDDFDISGEDSDAGEQVGTLTITGPTSEDATESDIVTDAPIVAPSYGWRLTHPREIFVWN